MNMPEGARRAGVDDCAEGVLCLTFSDCKVPINLGSTEIVSMNKFAKIVLSIEGKDQGVYGCTST